MNKKRIGFFGGCFNPVTIAHINLIKETIEKCELDKVYFVPMGDFYLKPELIPAKYRYEMLKLRIKRMPVYIKERKKYRALADSREKIKEKNELFEQFYKTYLHVGKKK